jgi:hypothetical protein
VLPAAVSAQPAYGGRERIMADYDSLPKEVRDALKAAPLNRCPGCCREALAKYGLAKTIAAIMRPG